MTARAQRPVSNLDESKVGAYTLPDPLVSADGRKVTTSPMESTSGGPSCCGSSRPRSTARCRNRRSPIRPRFQVQSEDKQALGGTAIRREVTIAFSEKPDGPRIDLLLYLPKNGRCRHRVPAFLGLNFGGNHTIHPDPGITLSRQWMRDERQRAS